MSDLRKLPGNPPRSSTSKFMELWTYITHRIHGAAIYGHIYHQYIPNVSINIPAPWILWVMGCVLCRILKNMPQPCCRKTSISWLGAATEIHFHCRGFGHHKVRRGCHKAILRSIRLAPYMSSRGISRNNSPRCGFLGQTDHIF